MIYQLSRKALNQIEEIIRYTDANFGEHQTKEYIKGLYDCFDILGRCPEIGRPYDESRRRHIYKGHQIYYRVLDGGVLIVDIRNSRQSPPDTS